MTRKYNYACSTCGSKLQKRGLTAAGTQRWYCVKCAKSSVRSRPDLERKLLLERFIKWILGRETQKEVAKRRSSYSESTWRRQTAWCWDVRPARQIKNLSSLLTPAIVLLDGIRIDPMVCLIARTIDGVLAWHYVPWESSVMWEQLLYLIPAPVVVVSDGQKGILLAIARCWPNTRIQRCHFHIWQNIRVKLTLRPATPAGIELLALTKELLKGIHTLEQRDEWIAKLKHFGIRYDQFLKQRTYHPNPSPSGKKWWYTHGRVRSAYRQLEKLLDDQQLFTYLEITPLDKNTGEIVTVPRTTNYVEGGINSPLRDRLKIHRGLRPEHQFVLVDWYLHCRKMKG